MAVVDPSGPLGRDQLAFPGILLYALGGLGPPLAAILLLYRIHPAGERRDYWRRVVDARRIGPVWYVVIFLLPLLLNVLGILTGVLLGSSLPSFESADGLLANPLSILPFAAVVLLFGPLPEELGWRGYALDGLQERRSALAASLILGAIWTLWHWPQFFMRDSYIGETFPLGSAVFWVGWVLPTVAYSVVYTWIYNRTRSVLLCMILHGAFNAAIGLFPASLDVLQRWTYVSLLCVQVATLLVFVLALVAATRGRLGRGSEPAPREE